METVHLIIKGKVQGVFYRATAKEVADQIGVTGWVKNREDGDVEAIVTGTQEQIAKFIDWCKKGPKRAVVTSTEVNRLAYQEFSDFAVKK